MSKNYLLFFLMITVVFTSCKNTSESEKDVELKVDKTTPSIKQEKKDLLNETFSAICYSGFRTGQHPDRGNGANNPTDEQILEDLNILTHTKFKLIRLYDSGENSETVLRLISENKIDIKVMLGVWLKAELSNHEGCAWLNEPIPTEILKANYLLNKEEINRGIALANKYPQVVSAVNVGNEALVDWNDHKVDTDSIISYVRKVKNTIVQPVTVAENYEWWASDGYKLAKEVDFISIHVYPVWEGKEIDEAMSYTIENVQKVRDSLPDSKIVISEAGWASLASEFGKRASEENQKTYYNQLNSFAKENNITTFFFEAFDEDWKGDPSNMMGAEKHWGLFTVDRKPKKVMQHLYPNI